MNGDDVRAVRFPPGNGYGAAAVNELLDRVAVELDAGRPAGPLIESATFPQRSGYEADAVDWFFGQLLAHPGGPGPAGPSGDPWPQFAVADYFTWSGPGDLARRSAEQPWVARGNYNSQVRKYFEQDCRTAWGDFGQLPGTSLWWGRAGWRRVLRTAEGQTLASLQGNALASLSMQMWSQGSSRFLTISAGGKRFTFQKTGRAQSSSPRAAEIAARSNRDIVGHFAPPGSAGSLANPRELADETGTPILYISGSNSDLNSSACITFPDQRWLRFPVRGTEPGNAIMTAVDEAGNRAVRYRAPGRIGSGIEITVHPHRELTDELVVAIAISAPWLRVYFQRPGGAA